MIDLGQSEGSFGSLITQQIINHWSNSKKADQKSKHCQDNDELILIITQKGKGKEKL